jgi:ABC-type transport system involved in multi-copper enzyme maturation permease subunit
MTAANAVAAEWTKLRTVRGWRVAAVLAVVLTVLFAYLVGNGANSGVCAPQRSGAERCGVGHPFVPTGPNGEAVTDSYYMAARQLTGDGTITTRVTGLTGVTSSAPANAAPSLSRTRPGLAAWSKAGLIITAGTRPGAPYAAVMATARHGIRFQDQYTHDRSGPSGSPTTGTPSWLRLTRTGARVTAYDSANGTTWHELGSTTLGGLRSTATVGLFVASPATQAGLATMATGTFDHVTLSGRASSQRWQGTAIGESHSQFYPVLGQGAYHRDGDVFSIRGSGDIGPAITATGDTAATILTQALIVTLIVIVLLAATFITSEYRRGLIRTTLSATPSRGRVLAAKAAVIAGATFVVGTIATAIAVPLGEHLLSHNGNFMYPTDLATQLRVILGSGAMLALCGVAVLAIGGLLRRTSGTVLMCIVVFVLPPIIAAPFISTGTNGSSPAWVEWLLRLTPAAGLSVVTSLPHSAIVSYPYTIANGYLPLSPAAGLGVVALWAIALSSLALVRMKRSDA